MARKKKQEDAPAGSPAWMATFSDLMNLLLCFFVLLFSMSSVDEAKYDELVESLSSAFSFFSGGASSIGDGQLINMGTAQLTELDEYYNNMGQTTDETGENIEKSYEEYKEALEQENKEATEAMYDKISELTTSNNLDDYIELSTDPEGSRYVQVNLNGSILFASGDAELKEEILPIMSKIGDILKIYDGYRIAIIGHTDNIPITSSRYQSNMHLSSARAITVAQYFIDVKGFDAATIEYTGRGESDPVADNSTSEGRAKNRRVEIRIYNLLNSD